MQPYIDSSGRFIYDTIENGVWYVMRPKANLGARAIPEAMRQIEAFNSIHKEESGVGMSVYAPRYTCQMAVGVFRDKYVFPNLFFVHSNAENMKLFMHERPYQLFYITDKSRKIDTNCDEYGNLTHDTYMRVSSRAIGEFFLTLNTYQEDLRLFTAQELQQLKYTHKVLIVDGPLQGRTCRIKSIEGKKRVIVELLEGNIGLVVLMPETHFQRV